MKTLPMKLAIVIVVATTAMSGQAEGSPVSVCAEPERTRGNGASTTHLTSTLDWIHLRKRVVLVTVPHCVVRS